MEQEYFMKILWVVFLRMFIATFLGLAAVVAVLVVVVLASLETIYTYTYFVAFLSVPFIPLILGIRYIVGAKKKYGESINGKNTATRMLALIGVLLIAGFLSSLLFATALFTLVPVRQPHGGQSYNDGVIMRDLETIRTQAEIYYIGAGGNTYGTSASTCFTGMFAADQTISKAIAAADTANKSGTIVCNSTPLAYAVSAQMTMDASAYWCIDSAGTSQKRGEKLGSSTVCPSVDYVRPEPSIMQSLFEVVKEAFSVAFLFVFNLNWYLLSGEWIGELGKLSP